MSCVPSHARQVARRASLLLAVVLVALSSTSGGLHAEDLGLDELAARTGRLMREVRYPEALSSAGQMAALAKIKHGELSAEHGRALGWMAMLLQLQGRIADAEPLFKQSLSILETALPPDHPDTATAINNIGFQYQLMERYEEAERHYKKALDIREKAAWPDYSHIADSLNNVAQIYKRQWRTAEAIPLLERSLAMREKGLGRQHPQIAQSLQNLASAMELQGQFTESEPLLWRALEIRLKAQGADNPETAGAMGKLAENLYKQGKFSEADPHFRTALATRRTTLAAGHIQIATSLTDLANNQIALGACTEAAGLIQEAITISEAALAPGHTEIARLRMVSARALSCQGRHVEALEQARAGTVIRQARPATDELSRVHYLRHLTLAWNTVPARDGRSTGLAPPALADEALQVVQRGALSNTGSTVAKVAARLASSDPALRDLVRQREETESQRARLEERLSAVLALPPDLRRAEDATIKSELAWRATAIADIDGQLKSRFPSYFELVRPAPLSVADVRALLTADEALVVLVTSYDETYVWAVTAEAVIWHRVDLSVGQVTSAVAALRATLDVDKLEKAEKGQAPLFDLALSHYLYQKLLGPLEDAIVAKRHVLFVPHGPLTSLPLHLLVTGGPLVNLPTMQHLGMFRDAHWLVRRHAISVLPSVDSLKGLRGLAQRRRTDQRPLIGIANPTFGVQRVAAAAAPPKPQRNKQAAKQTAALAPASPLLRSAATQTRSLSAFWAGTAITQDALRSLPPLPETETELRTVARHLKASNRDLLFGAAATEANVRSMDLTQFRVVYFATHGLVAGELKGLGEPALALTLPAVASEADDGLLTASEVSQLRLDADWVVLAACNTAAGNHPGAEALSGLARAFFHAGARALLVSHWPVGSEAAAKLTTSTFEIQQSNATIGKAQALQQAMLRFLADDRDPWAAYPAFWAPFTVIGDGLK